MAEFCKDCFKKYIACEDIADKQIIMSKEEDFCEGCNKLKPVVIRIEKRFFERK